MFIFTNGKLIYKNVLKFAKFYYVLFYRELPALQIVFFVTCFHPLWTALDMTYPVVLQEYIKETVRSEGFHFLIVKPLIYCSATRIPSSFWLYKHRKWTKMPLPSSSCNQQCFIIFFYNYKHYYSNNINWMLFKQLRIFIFPILLFKSYNFAFQ